MEYETRPMDSDALDTPDASILYRPMDSDALDRPDTSILYRPMDSDALRQLFFAATAACATYLVRWDSLAAELRSTCHSARIHDVVFPVPPTRLRRGLPGTPH